MKTKGKAWQLILTVLVIAAFVYTAFFGVAVKYGDVTTTYIKGAKDIRFGVDIKGGVNVTFVPSDGYDATDDQLEAAQLVIENRLVALNVTDYELYVDNNSDSLILEFPWQSGETEFDPEAAIEEIKTVDRSRKNYHNYYCDTKWGDARGYDMTVKSDVLGFEGTAKMLIAYIRSFMEQD